jgi:hypothetical protein
MYMFIFSYMLLMLRCFELHQHQHYLPTQVQINFFKPFLFISHFIYVVHGWSSRKNNVHFRFYDVVPTCGSYLQFPCPRSKFSHKCIHSHGNCEFLFYIATFHENNLTISLWKFVSRIKVLGETMKYNMIFKIFAHRIWR